MSVGKTIEIYADTRGVSRCTGPTCGQKILWAQVVKSGKKMCFNDIELVALSTRREMATGRLIESVDLDANHWATCSDVNRFGQRKNR